MTVSRYTTAAGVRWRYRLDLGFDEQGKRLQPGKGGFVSQDEAVAAEAEAERKFRKAKDRGIASRGTLARALRDWVETRTDIEPTSVSDFRYRFKQYVIPYIGELELHRASDPMVIAGLYTTLKDRGAKARTRAEKAAAAADPTWKKGLAETSVYAVHLSLMAALRDLGIDVSDVRSPKRKARKGDRRNRKQGRRGVWSIQQVQQFLSAVRGTRTYLAWCLFAISGVRRGEVAGLRWSAVDLETGLVDIEYQRTTLTGGGGIHEGDPKQGSFRPLILGPQMLALFRQHREKWLVEQERFAVRGRVDWKAHDFVFTNNTSGMPYYPGHFSHQFVILTERSGLPRIALHDIRHSVATNSRPLSIDIKTMQAQLGHSDTSMLLDIYTHSPEIQAIQASLAVMESAVLNPVDELLEQLVS